MLGTSPSSFKVTTSSKRHMVEDTDNHGSEPRGGENWGSGGPTEAKQTATESGSRPPQAITNRLYRRWVATGVASGVDGDEDDRPC